MCICSGATKAVLGKVKADLEADPKESFNEEEMAAVSYRVTSIFVHNACTCEKQVSPEAANFLLKVN